MVIGKGLEIDLERNVIILGEAGSGKTEIAISLALAIKEQVSEDVFFLDMDQTKPMFRARDAKNIMRERGIIFPIQAQFMDAPVVPHGVVTLLRDSGSYLLMDVGGNQMGAVCMGQFADVIKETESLIYYVINPYRAFSNSVEHIKMTMEQTLGLSGLDGNIHIISNPYIGPETDWDDVLEGNDILEKMLEKMGLRVEAVAIQSSLWDKCSVKPVGCWIPVYGCMHHVHDCY